MGNRAVITNDMNGLGVYLHWNGGRDSVEAFLEYCKLKGYRTPDSDRSYGYAQLVTVIANFFGGGLSVGVDLCANLDCDNYDNGVYIIKGWDIVDRKYFKGTEQNEYNRHDMLLAIDEAQPEETQIKDFLQAKEVPLNEVKIGDNVVFIDYSGKTQTGKVIGYGNGIVNGEQVDNIPYMNLYSQENPGKNPNNYIKTETVRIMEEKEQPEEKENSVQLFINDELNGIELKFSAKPDEQTRKTLKEKGFKWHCKKAVWYAKKNPDRLEYAQKIAKSIL